MISVQEKLPFKEVIEISALFDGSLFRDSFIYHLSHRVTGKYGPLNPRFSLAAVMSSYIQTTNNSELLLTSLKTAIDDFPAGKGNSEKIFNTTTEVITIFENAAHYSRSVSLLLNLDQKYLKIPEYAISIYHRKAVLHEKLGSLELAISDLYELTKYNLET